VATAHAAAPGIQGTSFNLTAQAAFITQPDGASILFVGLRCATAPPAAAFVPAMPNGQLRDDADPGTDAIVTEVKRSP